MKRIIAILLIILCVSGCGVTTGVDDLSVNFINVGQGDSSVLIMPDKQVMVIDAGEKDEVNSLIGFLDKRGITKIDVLVATHPHSDHIGGMVEVLKNYSVSKIYMPKISHDTATYKRFLQSIVDLEIPVTEAKAGVEVFGEGSPVSAYFVAPNGNNYEELNDYSAVLKVKYKDIAFLFTGDAEKKSETEMLSSGYDLSADVLKVGHHGSNTSTSAEFLRAVYPKFAIISADGESESHPHKKTLSRLNGINILTTFTDGTITFTTDGVTLERR